MGRSSAAKGLVEAFKKIYNNESTSDFVVEVGDERFFVHSLILVVVDDFVVGLVDSLDVLAIVVVVVRP